MAILVVALVAAMGLVAGCVESSDEGAQTPSGAATVANSALQTDSDGKFVTAPGATAPAEGGGTDTSGAGPGSEGEAGGDAAAGQEIFAATCTGCHLNNGQDAGGVGPQLAGLGRTPTIIETTVTNGKNAMPGGLVSGTDLDNVVAYVVSIQ